MLTLIYGTAVEVDVVARNVFGRENICRADRSRGKLSCFTKTKSLVNQSLMKDKDLISAAGLSK